MTAAKEATEADALVGVMTDAAETIHRLARTVKDQDAQINRLAKQAAADHRGWAESRRELVEYIARLESRLAAAGVTA